MIKLFLKSVVIFYLISLILNYFFDDKIYFLKNIVTSVFFSLTFSYVFTKYIENKKTK